MSGEKVQESIHENDQVSVQVKYPDAFIEFVTHKCELRKLRSGWMGFKLIEYYDLSGQLTFLSACEWDDTITSQSVWCKQCEVIIGPFVIPLMFRHWEMVHSKDNKQ